MATEGHASGFRRVSRARRTHGLSQQHQHQQHQHQQHQSPIRRLRGAGYPKRDALQGGACEPAPDTVDGMCELASAYGELAEKAARVVATITDDDLLYAAFGKASETGNTVLLSAVQAFGDTKTALSSDTAATATYMHGTLQQLAQRMSYICGRATAAEVLAFLSQKAALPMPLEPWSRDVYQDLYIKCVPKTTKQIQVFFMSGKRAYLEACVPCTARSLLQHPTVKAAASAQKKSLKRVIHGGAEASIVTAAMDEVHVV